jgi:UDP-N-acetylglucosamine 1-carboxyvinyltransferase
MDKYIVKGGRTLNGEVRISGSKNASLPMLAGTILTGEEVILHNIPDLADISMMLQLLDKLGKKTEWIAKNSVRITETDNTLIEAPYDIVRKMRASIAVMGPLLARRKQAKISFPGGCAIGPRPIDIHIRGMEELGTELVIQHGYIWAQAKELTGKRMNLLGTHGPSVLATENVMMAAALAKGTTYIEGAAEEPEVEALGIFLNMMGAKISGLGTPIIEIEGVESLHGVEFTVIPDRIEAGTFIAAAGITGGKVHLRDIDIHHLDYPIEKFSEAGMEFELLSETELIAKAGKIKPVQIETKPYPYFPTDMQAQIMAVVSLCEGISVIRENIFPDRFTHAAEMNRLGAEIQVDGMTAVIKGVDHLSGAAVMASDLRAGAGLVVSTLASRGQSEVLRIYHIDRGYEQFEQKLQALGADIERAAQE